MTTTSCIASSIASDEDKPLILDAIERLGDQAYGYVIQQTILLGTDGSGGKYLPLDVLYELLIDLIEEDVVTSQRITVDGLPGWRKLFSLTQPSSPVQES